MNQATAPDMADDRVNLSTLIAPYLPYLRRYARSLTGAQTAGDAFVAQTLEALIADRDVMDHDLEPRVGLYKLFQSIWDSAGIPADGAADDATTPRARQYLLLTAVEEFSATEAATILSIAPDEAAVIAADAVKQLRTDLKARVMIIEDEPIIAFDLKRIVTGMGHDVVGISTTHADAVALCADAKPDLILADIQLADGSSGVEAVDEILTAHDVPVIFVTAYPERLLTGDRVEPPFLITKPFRVEAVEAAIAQALFHTPK